MKADRDDPPFFGREQCLALLTSVPIGRVVYTNQALPAVMPMNFVLDGDEVTIHTGSSSTMAAAIRNAVVAFQADDYDPVAMTGWSVTITGQARLVGDPEETARLARLAVDPWVHTPNGQFVRIPCTHVSGGRIGPLTRADGMRETAVHDQAC